MVFFAAHGVDVPPEHRASGVAPDTAGGAFDWQQVFGGLYRVHSCAGDRPPAFAKVAVPHKGHWYSVDARDRDTKATFALLVELSRLELGAKAGSAPILTLPLGRR